MSILPVYDYIENVWIIQLEDGSFEKISTDEYEKRFGIFKTRYGNTSPGFYWVVQHEKSPKPTIARLTKNGGWEYMASEHSSKMIKNGPYKIVSHRLEQPNAKQVRK